MHSLVWLVLLLLLVLDFLTLPALHSCCWQPSSQVQYQASKGEKRGKEVEKETQRENKK